MLIFRSPARFIPIALAVSLVSCHDTTSSGPNGFLTGTWGSSYSNGFTQLTVQAAGGIVTGTYVEVCCTSNTVLAQATVTGTYGGGGFTLNFTFPAKAAYWMGTNATWTGRLTEINGSDWLEGQLTEDAPAQSTLISNFMLGRVATE